MLIIHIVVPPSTDVQKQHQHQHHHHHHHHHYSSSFIIIIITIIIIIIIIIIIMIIIIMIITINHHDDRHRHHHHHEWTDSLTNTDINQSSISPAGVLRKRFCFQGREACDPLRRSLSLLQLGFEKDHERRQVWGGWCCWGTNHGGEQHHPYGNLFCLGGSRGVGESLGTWNLNLCNRMDC